MTSATTTETKLRFFEQIPKLNSEHTSHSVLIYDRKLERICPSLIQAFPNRVGVTAGEGLKSFASAEKVLAKVLKMTEGLSAGEIFLISLGGGSVGDFTGFCASILKRGTGLISIPSTWLSAIDSAHGGKTALNVAGFKNQVGTFWPADEVWLIKPILISQPKVRTEEALGEVYKMALIAGKSLWTKLQDFAAKSKTPLRPEQLWSLLPDLIRAKMNIVKKDPFEQSGLRAVLNLGHTVGHVLEAEQRLPHGKAVLLGLAFVLRWMEHETRMSGKFDSPLWVQEIQRWPLWPKSTDLEKSLARVKDWGSALRRDKKSLGRNSINFVYVKKPGQCLAQRTPVSVIEDEIERQRHE